MRNEALLGTATRGSGIMKVLITTDLHYRAAWFEWLIREASHFDAVFIAGDFLDIFIAESRTAQAAQAQRWLRGLAKVTKLAICSGNHDNAGVQIVRDRAHPPEVERARTA
jgi:predicted phosphodiesterase